MSEKDRCRGQFQDKLGGRRGPFDPYPPILDPLPLVEEEDELSDTKPTRPFPKELLEVEFSLPRFEDGEEDTEPSVPAPDFEIIVENKEDNARNHRY